MVVTDVNPLKVEPIPLNSSLGWPGGCFDRSVTDAADFYTGFVVDAYAALKSETFDAGRYAAFVRQHGEPGLEVGCGDGHPILELVAQGLDVDGVDSSPDMIERAQGAARGRGLEVGLHVARMEDMDLGRRYRAIYLAGPTFELLPNDETARRALDAFRNHLAPGGSIMVPLWIPEATPASALGVAREAKDETGAVLRFTALSEELDVPARTRRTRVRYERTSPDGSTESIDRDWLIHWQTPETIRSLAAEAGLVVRTLEPEPAPGNGELRPGAEFTAYLHHD